MEQIFPENWALMHYGIILSLTAAQMLVVYVLADSSKPPAGLGLFTVYFMASLLGWIALTLQQNADLQLAVNVPSVMIILNSYILFMAAGQRADVLRGRLLLGSVCLLAGLSGLPDHRRRRAVGRVGRLRAAQRCPHRWGGLPQRSALGRRGLVL